VSIRTLAKHRAPVRPSTPLSVIGDAVSTSATAVSRRSAVIAASSGLVVTMGLPAAGAAPLIDVSPEPSETGNTQQIAAVPSAPISAPISVPAEAQVSFALAAVTTVDAAAFEAEKARVEAERVAAEQAAAAEAAEAAAAEASQREQAAAAASRTSSRSSARTSSRAASAPAAEAVSNVKSAPVSSGSSAAIDIAKRYIGTPYVFGGTSPSGFDCSGFVQYVYNQLGVSLPRTAAAQAQSGTRISASEARPGDIVSFTGSGGVYHNGLYVGDGMMIDSPRSGKSIDVRSIWSSSVTFTRVG